MADDRKCVHCQADIMHRPRPSMLCHSCAQTNDTRSRAAHKKVGRAVRNGRLAEPKSLRCADCGYRAAVYDHRDYAHPLDVSAVCHSCNYRRGPAAAPLKRLCSP